MWIWFLIYKLKLEKTKIYCLYFSGRSHDKSYQLFKVGQPSSAGMKQFSEQGGTDILDEESQGEGGIFDEFNAPPITEGVGQTEAEFFVDGNHSRVIKVFPLFF